MRRTEHDSVMTLALSQDGKWVGAVGIEITREKMPMEVWKLERLAADPEFEGVTRWLAAVGGDLREWPLYGKGGQRVLIVDVTDRGGATTLRSRVLGAAVGCSRAYRKWSPSLGLIDMVSGRAGPGEEGPFFAVPRVDVLGEAERLQLAGRVAMTSPGTHAPELGRQLDRMMTQKEKADPAAMGGDLATGLVLGLWWCGRVTRRSGRGGVVGGTWQSA